MDAEQGTERDAEVRPSVVEVAGPELARCSALADELARLLVPSGLFT